MTTGEEEFLESLCKQLYESADAQQRASAERALSEFSESSECFQKCLLLLERGSSAYTQLVASTTLTKLISRPSPVVSLQQRVELRNYLVSYLASRSGGLPNFVVTSLCQLFARLTKIGWFDFDKDTEMVFRNSVEEILKLIQVDDSPEHCVLAVQLLGHIVAEMNQPSALGSITKHRKIAASFRDIQLFDIFQLSVKLLQTAVDNIKTVLNDESQLNLISSLLELSLNCLTFDFIGSMVDDTSDDNVSVQVPTAWRVAFVDTTIVKLFYSLYEALPTVLTSKALGCLVQLASVRRTIFNNNERQLYLAALLIGSKGILDRPQGLSDHGNYHEFCRLIARLKSNYQLTELIKVDEYPKTISMLTDFTVTSLQMHQFAANSIHYLLSFWQRMVSSMPYVKSNEPHMLEQFAPLVSKAYIESRLNLVATVISDGLEDPLDDVTSLGQQLEQISVIGRCDYEKTCALLLQAFDAAATSFQQSLGSQPLPLEQKLQEGRLTWLVFIIGAAIGGRVAFSSSEEHDLIDGDLICRVLQLMRLTDERLPSNGNEKMEMGFLWFLEQFRKIYISDQVQKTSKVYGKLTDVLGLTDEAAVLGVFVRKIITNLKYWSANEKIVDDTLTLLNDLSIGYSSVRKLVRLPEIQFLMNNHTSEHFSFLGTNTDLKTMKSRSVFHTALMRLLCVDLGDDEDTFESFMLPISSGLNELTKVFSLAESAIVSQDEARRAVIGLARDIRGVAFASNTKTAYIMLFDWIYPNYLAIFLRAIEIWFSDPDLTTPVLKLMNELCQNRSQRLQFDVSSPNAILLFKEASKFISAYGSRILAIGDIPKDQLYRLRLKGVTVCFGILKAALCGSYVNFGVFRLYGDNCLEDALSMFVKLLLSIPQQDLLAYSKLSQNYYFLMECLAQDHMTFVSQMDSAVFVYILQTLHEGLTALDTMVCTCCCSTLDYIISYLYKRVTRAGKQKRVHAGMPPEGTSCLRTLEQQPEILRQMLSSILNVVMFEECRCQWSMSRPLLGLILLQEEELGQLKMQLIGSQPAEKQSVLDQSFSRLMDGIERNLTIKNKDRFTQNLSVFRRDVNDCLKGVNAPVIPASASSGNFSDNMMS